MDLITLHIHEITLISLRDFYTLQMDEEEKYNRKLESGLYTLQVCIGVDGLCNFQHTFTWVVWVVL